MYLSFMIPSSSSRYTCPTIPFASILPISGSSLSNHASGNANTNNGLRRTIPLSFSSPGSGLGSGSGADGQQDHGNEKDGSGGGGGGGGVQDDKPIRHYHTMATSVYPLHSNIQSNASCNQLHIIKEDFGQGLLMLFVQKNALSLHSLAPHIQSTSLCVRLFAYCKIKIWRDGGFKGDYDAEVDHLLCLQFNLGWLNRVWMRSRGQERVGI
ncbi:hypothetical protein D9758_010611 [Tetrapyrgos nigripes]|uniref:Uncharacterized protein n=1 Tax=Tetrapyrgos nigripes TaxID=182062 RepID=A0A8H5D5F8_9AGAR|nr:hypothetical protein D9758_010611 [Tetrapyrgos nigripes]